MDTQGGRRRAWGRQRRPWWLGWGGLLWQWLWLGAWVCEGVTLPYCKSLLPSSSYSAWSALSVWSSGGVGSCVFYVQLDQSATCADFCSGLLLNSTLAYQALDCAGVLTPTSPHSCGSAGYGAGLCSDASAVDYCCACSMVTPSPSRMPTQRPVRPSRRPTRMPTRRPTRTPTLAPSVPPVPLVPLDAKASVVKSLSCLGLHPALLQHTWGLWTILGVVLLSWLLELMLRCRSLTRCLPGGHKTSRVHNMDHRRNRAAEVSARERLARVQSGSLYLGLPPSLTEPLVLLNPLALTSTTVTPYPPDPSKTRDKDKDKDKEKDKSKSPPPPSSSAHWSPPSTFSLSPPVGLSRGYWWRDLRFHLLHRQDLCSLVFASPSMAVLSTWDSRAVFLVVYSGLHLLAHAWPLPLSSSPLSSLAMPLLQRCALGCLGAQALRRLCRSRFPYPPPVFTFSLSRLVLSRDHQAHGGQQAGRRYRVASPLALLVALCCPWLTSPPLLLTLLALSLLLGSYLLIALPFASAAHECLLPVYHKALLHDAALTFFIMAMASLLTALFGDLLAFWPAGHSQRCTIMGWCAWDVGRWRLDLLLTLLAEEHDINLKAKVRRLMRRYRARRGLGGNEGVEDFADYLRVGLPPHKWLHIVLLDFPVLVLHSYVLPKAWRRPLSKAGELVSLSNEEKEKAALEAQHDDSDDDDDEEGLEQERKRREKRRKEKMEKEQRKAKNRGRGGTHNAHKKKDKDKGGDKDERERKSPKRGGKKGGAGAGGGVMVSGAGEGLGGSGKREGNAKVLPILSPGGNRRTPEPNASTLSSRRGINGGGPIPSSTISPGDGEDEEEEEEDDEEEEEEDEDGSSEGDEDEEDEEEDEEGDEDGEEEEDYGDRDEEDEE